MDFNKLSYSELAHMRQTIDEVMDEMRAKAKDEILDEVNVILAKCVKYGFELSITDCGVELIEW